MPSTPPQKPLPGPCPTPETLTALCRELIGNSRASARLTAEYIKTTTEDHAKARSLLSAWANPDTNAVRQQIKAAFDKLSLQALERSRSAPRAFNWSDQEPDEDDCEAPLNEESAEVGWYPSDLKKNKNDSNTNSCNSNSNSNSNGVGSAMASEAQRRNTAATSPPPPT